MVPERQARLKPSDNKLFSAPRGEVASVSQHMYQLAIFTLGKTKPGCFMCAMFENPLPPAQTVLFYFKKHRLDPPLIRV